MEEELNEHGLEERLYAMLYYGDETQNNVTNSQPDKNHAVFEENAPRSTMRRYWRTGPDTNPYQKVNYSKKPATIDKNTPDNPITKEQSAPHRTQTSVDLSILQSPVAQITQKTIQIIDHENDAVELESSDEDEVVEVALPPKPTITIESSDEEELIVQPQTPKNNTNCNPDPKTSSGERDATASPVPSIVSSVSDEFIRGDCIALNISSRKPDKPSFDFSLHGSDLIVQNTSLPASKKKRKKKNKEAVTSTPNVTPPEKPTNTADECFATPKSKAKNKKQRGKLFTEKTIPALDVDDSDSNQSIDTNKNKNPYIVTKSSVPNVDVYESDSNQSEIHKEYMDLSKNRIAFEAYSSDSSVSDDKPKDTAKNANKNVTKNATMDSIDLTENENYITLDYTGITESIVMGNVTGFTDSYGDESRKPSSNDISKYVSSRVPSILNEDLDFDHLKGKDKVCKRRTFSPTTLSAEMEKFYNESWGGENFNHKEIQKHMSRDKSLWAIDPKDRMQSPYRKPKCNYCNRVGHRDDTCRQKPPICYMCGNYGHYEPRCPNKICLNCGSPNFMYSTMCRQCSGWRGVTCAECRQVGHLASHCPDVWRRYHNTINIDGPLETCPQIKKPHQLYCSGCSRRGHLVHECRTTIPFSGLPVNSPFVYFYRPTFANNNAGKKPRSKSFSQDTPVSSAMQRDKQKRASKSPTVYETHVSKKRHLSLDECPNPNAKSPAVQKNPPQPENTTKNKSTPKEAESSKNKNKSNVDAPNSVTTTEKAPNYIPITSNRDNEGHLIQDNEVSDTSDVVTSARIYVTNDIISNLQTKEGKEWLKANMESFHVTVSPSDASSFLTIKGKLADQEAFQSALRDWASADTNKPKNDECIAENQENKTINNMNNMPKNRNNLLQQLTKALDSLKEDLGDPGVVYKELTFSQAKHKKLLKQKVISPHMLSKSRTHINKMLQKLNTILLGQAGLADGPQHVNELQSFRDKLMNSREKNISTTIRKDIAEHYHRIFTSIARDDYQDLVMKYYSNRGLNPIAGKRMNRNRQKQNNSISADENNEFFTMNTTYMNNNNQNFNSRSPTSIHLTKLKFYHTRLRKSMPKNRASKQEKLHIMRRVHAFIESLQKNDRVPSKIIKKVKKIQLEAQKFLSESM